MRRGIRIACGIALFFALGIVALAQENASPVEIARACREGRIGDTTAVLVTVGGNQGTYYFYTGEGEPDFGYGGQCVATLMAFIRDGLTVTIP